MKSLAECAHPDKSRPSLTATSASLRGSYNSHVVVFFSYCPTVLSFFHSSSILKYLVRKYNLPEHWYPSDVKRQAKIDEYLGWHGTNLRRGGAWYLANKVGCVYIHWNLRIKDTLGQGILSFIERFPLFGGWNWDE